MKSKGEDQTRRRENNSLENPGNEGPQKMMPNILRLGTISGLTPLLVAFVTIACLQEKTINVKVDAETPPSFSVSGNSTVVDFLVENLPRTKPPNKTDAYSVKGETIWKISAPNSIKAASWPRVRYGEVPMGFSQAVPDHGAPPKLAEGKLYAARFLDGSKAESVIFFEIQNGKIVNVTDEFFRP